MVHYSFYANFILAMQSPVANDDTAVQIRRRCRCRAAGPEHVFVLSSSHVYLLLAPKASTDTSSTSETTAAGQGSRSDQAVSHEGETVEAGSKRASSLAP